MKRFNIFFILWFLSFSIGSSLYSSYNDNGDNDELDLSIIFQHYIEIIDRHTNSKDFLKDWGILEYLEFLDLLNENRKLIEKYSEKDQVSLSTTNKNLPIKIRDISTTTTIISTISSVFSEIFGSLHLKLYNDRIDYLFTSNTYLIPESMLDPNEVFSEYFDKQKNTRRHDGALIKIEGDNVYIYYVFESKFSGNVDIKQIKGVFDRWNTDGIIISRRLFSPDNIYILNSANKFKPIKKCEYKDFERLLYFTGVDLKVNNSSFKHKYPFLSLSDLSQKDVINKNIFKSISTDLLVSLSFHNASKILEEITNKLIKKVVIELKNYIDTYNQIPSLDYRVETIPFYKKHQKTADTDEDIDNIDNYDLGEIKDLIISLYYIYHSNELHPIFQKQLSHSFTSEEIDRLYSLLDNDEFVHIDRDFNIEEIINSLVKILGSNHRKHIESVVYQNLDYMRSNYKTFMREFNKKYSLLFVEFRNSFEVEDIKKLILNNLEYFIVIKYSKLRELLNYLNSDLKFYKLDDVKYRFLDLYLNRLISIKFSDKNLIEIHRFITKVFMDGDSIMAFEFILKNFRLLNDISFPNFQKNYRYLSVFFRILDQDSIHQLFLDNINTLLYLKEDNFKVIVTYLSHKLNFSHDMVEEIIIKNFSKLHRINLFNMIENVDFVVQYLESIEYEFEIYELIRDRLYKISYIDKDKARKVLEFLDVFLGKEYRFHLYRWLVEEKESFENINIDEFKESISFLVNKLEDKELLKLIILNLDNLYSLVDSKLWNLIIDRIHLKLARYLDNKDQKEMIKLLLEQGFLDFNSLFSSLDKLNGKEINKESSSFTINEIDNWITTLLTRYYQNKICSRIFMENL